MSHYLFCHLLPRKEYQNAHPEENNFNPGRELAGWGVGGEGPLNSETSGEEKEILADVALVVGQHYRGRLTVLSSVVSIADPVLLQMDRPTVKSNMH